MGRMWADRVDALCNTRCGQGRLCTRELVAKSEALALLFMLENVKLQILDTP